MTLKARSRPEGVGKSDLANPCASAATKQFASCGARVAQMAMRGQSVKCTYCGTVF